MAPIKNTPPQIQHNESNVKVYFTRDYTQFKAVIGNRLLNEGKIKRIIAEIQSGLDLLKYYPIVVDEDMNVIDGQHRLYICRSLKCNVFYIIAKKITLHQIATVNSNQERWKTKDFMHCNIVQNNKNYEELRDFAAKYGFPLNVCIQLLSTGTLNTGGAGKVNFEKGLFEVKNMKEATEIADLVTEFKDFPEHKARNFIAAITKIHNTGKCDFSELVKKYKKNQDRLKTCDSAKEYMKTLEDLYNIYLHTRTTIF